MNPGMGGKSDKKSAKEVCKVLKSDRQNITGLIIKFKDDLQGGNI
jgi:uncharacterized protein YcgL (UPF0745 family)